MITLSILAQAVRDQMCTALILIAVKQTHIPNCFSIVSKPNREQYNDYLTSTFNCVLIFGTQLEKTIVLSDILDRGW